MISTVKKAKKKTTTRKTDQPYTSNRTGACQAKGLVVPVFRPKTHELFLLIDFEAYERIPSC
jgi:hypothetical protein